MTARVKKTEQKSQKNASQILAKVEGPIVMIGFGSIGRGILPLLERHLDFDRSRLVVIDPDDSNRKLCDERGIKFVKADVTKDNYKELLTPLLTAGEGAGLLRQPFR